VKVFKGRDYLFATKDYASALEYVRQRYKFAEIFDLTRSIVSHGEEHLSVNRLDERGRPSSFTEDVKIGVIKFDNGSRIIAFSANPQAMAVYGGDVGLDEFAKHPNARLLWETAQGQRRSQCSQPSQPLRHRLGGRARHLRPYRAQVHLRGLCCL
jgi:phage FluMu gp28-like protein